ncbi:MAG: hypothetical protein QF561_05970 [Phycisphaerales bacterium]|jgi:hypothetical protein|nr:hypothetical protein [Phycisphaerales bacterium]
MASAAQGPPRGRRSLGTWAVVLGTIMVAIACFDAAWGLATVALGEHLQIIAGDLDDSRLGIAVGRTVHFVTFGVLTVSGVETAEHAKSLLDMLPRPNYLVEVGWIRFGYSLCGVLLGLVMAFRLRVAVPLVLCWSVLALAWSVWSTVRTWSLTVDHLGDPMNGGSLPMFTTELAIHFVWPMVLAWRTSLHLIRRSRGTP